MQYKVRLMSVNSHLLHWRSSASDTKLFQLNSYALRDVWCQGYWFAVAL